jgi:formylglycine-generating enzyme required for sulfatase activity
VKISVLALLLITLLPAQWSCGQGRVGPKPKPPAPEPSVRPEPAPKPAPTQPAAQVPEIEMVRIEAGSFTMGSTNGFDDKSSPHRVTISRPFYIGKYEVTQAQWRAVMGSNPSSFKGDNLPVEQVSWEDCQEFIRRLNAKTGGGWRLPTEAEWEYACRAGTSGDYAGVLDQMAWYDSNSGRTTHPIGQKQPNAWGLYDMHGNVWEWRQDWYDSDFYGRSPGTDPVGPSSGSTRVLRGGSWNFSAAFCRSAIRHWFAPSLRYDSLGFRLASTRHRPEGKT